MFSVLFCLYAVLQLKCFLKINHLAFEHFKCNWMFPSNNSNHIIEQNRLSRILSSMKAVEIAKAKSPENQSIFSNFWKVRARFNIPVFSHSYLDPKQYHKGILFQLAISYQICMWSICDGTIFSQSQNKSTVHNMHIHNTLDMENYY